MTEGDAPAGDAVDRAPELQEAFDAIVAARDDPERVLELLADYPEDEDVEALLIGADALVELARFDHAMDVYEEVERLAPGRPEAARGVAQITLLKASGGTGLPLPTELQTPEPAPPEPEAAPPEAPKGPPEDWDPLRGPSFWQKLRTQKPTLDDHVVNAAGFACAGALVLAFAAFRLVTEGWLTFAAWSLAGTGIVGAVIGFGLHRRAALAWWAGVGFVAGAALVVIAGVAGLAVGSALDATSLALSALALVTTAALSWLLWRSRAAYAAA